MNKFLKLSVFGSLLLVFGSCKKFVDINDNPNVATETTANGVFTGALAHSYRVQVSTNVHIVPGTWAGHYAHSTSFTGGGAEKTYAFTNADFNAWDVIFDNISDYRYVVSKADAEGVSLWKAPATVMEAYMYQMLVDLYGNVPYTEAFKEIGNITPKFDDQQAIYENLVVRLDTAISQMAAATWTTNADITRNDVLFQGNKDKWIRFANTVKLRILMRQSFMPGRDAYITTNINSTLSRGYLLENVLVQPSYMQLSGKLNPFYNNYGYNELNNIVTNHQYRKMNAVLVNWLKTGAVSSAVPPSRPTTGQGAGTVNADTFRLQALVWPAGTSVSTPSNTLSTYVGIPMGIGSGYSTAGSSAIGPMVIQQGQATRPGLLMLAAEAYLLQAEAAHRYAIAFAAGDDKALYEAGVRSHFRTCAAPTLAAGSTAGDAFANRYLARTTPYQSWDATPADKKIRAILIQKWTSLVHINGLEAWSEYRKSSGTDQVGVPFSPKSVVVEGTDPEPVRYLYPMRETNVNAANVPTGIDKFTSRIFWDVN